MQTGNLKAGDRAYNMTVQTYTQSTQVTVQKGCFAFMFTNLGGANANVNGMVIFPPTGPGLLGDSRSISAHKSDIYKGNITLAIDPAGPTPLVEIVQLFYADYQT